jgi:hypothetical protein
MKKAPGRILLLLGLTSLQTVGHWLLADRLIMRLNLGLWLGFLGLLASYTMLLRAASAAAPLMKFHRWAYAHITGRRLIGLGILFFGGYTVWYTQRMWGELLVYHALGALFYRYTILDQVFPQFLAYNPLLNGGGMVTSTLTSGPVNLFLFTYPLRAFFSLETAFKAQPLLVMLLLPVVIYLSGRLVGFSRRESCLAAAFALVMSPPVGYSGSFLRGALPYVFSCEMAIVVFALIYRVFVLGKNAAWGLPLIVLLGSLGSFHPLFAVVMGPPALAVVVFGRLPWTRKLVYCALIGAGLLVLNGSFIYTLLSYRGEGMIGRWLSSPEGLPMGAWLFKLARNFLVFPVALVLGSLVGVNRLLHSSGEVETTRLGGLLLFTILYYVFLSSIGYFLIGSLQPAHYKVALGLFLSLALGAAWPVVEEFCGLLKQDSNATAFGCHAAFVLLILFLCLPYVQYFVIFPSAPPETHRLIDWLRQDADNKGRVYISFPTFPRCQEDRWFGDASFYQAKTQRPIMGATPFHRLQGWVCEIDACLRDPATAAMCMELYNIHYVVALSDADAGPQPRPGSLAQEFHGFSLVQSTGRMRIYASEHPSSYFLVGRGQVDQRPNRLTVTAEPSEFVILKFFWAPGLRVEPPLALEPYPLSNGRAFIKVRSNYRKNFAIVYD